MSANTSIQWTDRTWNPIRGCSLVSEGCTNCYAMKIAHRWSGPGQPYEGLTRMTEHGPVWSGKIKLVERALEEPLRWKRPQRIFVNSMSDLFHEDVPWRFIEKVFETMRRASQHTFQILTKRPHRALKCFALPNVWLGVSVENQATADERIPLLLQTPAAVRFLSVEPLLEHVNIRLDQNRAFLTGPCLIDWVIVGGESGASARPCDVDWIREIVGECKRWEVPVFVKQLGSFPILSAAQITRVCLIDRHGGLPAEWPDDLRRREFPE